MSKNNTDTIIASLTFGDASPKVLDCGENKTIFVLKNAANQFLAIAWDFDNTGEGFWRIRQIGVEDGQMVSKALRPGNPTPAFYGEVAVVGTEENDLFTSYGYEDDDIVDAEGNVVNKVREIRIYPKRD